MNKKEENKLTDEESERDLELEFILNSMLRSGPDLGLLEEQISKERKKVLTTEELKKQCEETTEWAKSIGANVVSFEEIAKKNSPKKNKKK